MYPFSYTGLRVLHDEKVHHAMEQARVDAALVRESQRTGRLLLPGKVLLRIRSRLNPLDKQHSRITCSCLR